MRLAEGAPGDTYDVPMLLSPTNREDLPSGMAGGPEG